MLEISCQVATPRYFERHGWVGHRLGSHFVAMVVVWNAAAVVVSIGGWKYSKCV